MKDVAAARAVWHGQSLPGTDAVGEVGDSGIGSEATVGQLEQADAPGLGIAVIFAAEQKAEGGSDIGAHQHGAAVLEDLIESGETHVGEILLAGSIAGPRPPVLVGVVYPCHPPPHPLKITPTLDPAPTRKAAAHGQGE